MYHPWVTDEGRAPLRSCADQGLGSIEVTTQEQLGAIDRASVVSMIRARLKEKVFRSNEYLFQAVSTVLAVLGVQDRCSCVSNSRSKSLRGGGFAQCFVCRVLQLQDYG
jgi:hypothetical protein